MTSSTWLAAEATIQLTHLIQVRRVPTPSIHPNMIRSSILGLVALSILSTGCASPTGMGRNTAGGGGARPDRSDRPGGMSQPQPAPSPTAPSPSAPTPPALPPPAAGTVTFTVFLDDECTQLPDRPSTVVLDTAVACNPTPDASISNLQCTAEGITYTNHPNTPDCTSAPRSNTLAVGVCTLFPGPVTTYKLIDPATYQCGAAPAPTPAPTTSEPSPAPATSEPTPAPTDAPATSEPTPAPTNYCRAGYDDIGVRRNCQKGGMAAAAATGRKAYRSTCRSCSPCSRRGIEGQRTGCSGRYTVRAFQ